MNAQAGPGWRPTSALLRCALGSVVLILPALVFGRPDLLVMGTPLLVITVWTLAQRPRSTPKATTSIAHTHVREGEGTLVRTTVDAGTDAEHVVVAVRPHKWIGFDETHGVQGVYVAGAGGPVTMEAPIRSLRWGRRQAGEGLVAVTSRWAGFRWGPVKTESRTLTTLPLPGRFDANAPTPHPVGLVGLNPSSRSGDGSEFSSIRPFTSGDRLRRIHWPVSLRTGSIHVTTAVAEQDSNVVLVVDALTDLGVGGRMDEQATSLDVAVRAAGAVSEHYLHRGDRVSLRVLGPARNNLVPSGSGKVHLRRILDTLARTVPGSNLAIDASQMQFGVGAGAVVIVLSPMLSAEAITATVTLASRGLDVVVIDTIPERLEAQEDERTRLAWRIRLLERAALLRRVQVAGIPVVAWRGPGTLDEVLRRLGRRASLPTLARR